MWQCRTQPSCHLALSEMFQKVQLAAMKNDKFHFVATVTRTQTALLCSSPQPCARLCIATFCAAFALPALFYYLSSLLRKQPGRKREGERGRRLKTFNCNCNCAATTFFGLRSSSTLVRLSQLFCRLV